MARSKLKLTGFARFFFVMLILAPLAYIGASYANGEDGLQNMKDLFKGKISMGKSAPESEVTESETTKTIEIPSATNAQPSGIDQAELDSKDEKIKSLIEKNIKLEEQLEEKSQELIEVKQQLKVIKDAIGGTPSEE